MANSSDKLLHDLEYRFSALISARKTGGKPATGRQAQHASESTTQTSKHNTHRRAHHMQANTTRIGEHDTDKQARHASESSPHVGECEKGGHASANSPRGFRLLAPEGREDSSGGFRLVRKAGKTRHASARQQIRHASANLPSIAKLAKRRQTSGP